MTAKNPANPTSRPLFELLTARGLTVSAVARTAGISEGILRAYRDTEGRGLNTRTLHKVLCAIAHLSGAPPPPELMAGELGGAELNYLTATAPRAGATPPGLASPANTEYRAPEPISPSAPRVPVRGTAQGGPQGAFVLTGDDIDYVRCPARW